jgi:hypothetical protein
VLAEAGHDILSVSRQETAAHAEEIFRKGYDFTASRDSREAINKSVSGLQTFLSLVVSVYGDKAGRTILKREAQTLRTICSSVLLGILEGYARVMLGNELGHDVLSRTIRSWAPNLAFFTAADIDVLLEKVLASELAEPLARSSRLRVSSSGW